MPALNLTSKLLSYAKVAKFQAVSLTTLNQFHIGEEQQFNLPANTKLRVEFGDWFNGRSSWLLFRLRFETPFAGLTRPALILGPDIDAAESKLITMRPDGDGGYIAIAYYIGQAYCALRPSVRAISIPQPTVEVAVLNPGLGKAIAAMSLVDNAVGTKTESARSTIADLQSFAWLTARDARKMAGYVKDALMGVESMVVPESPPTDLTEYETWFHRNTEISTDTYEHARELSEAFPIRPKFSVVVPTYRSNELYLRDMVESVKRQIYNNWELILIDDGSGSEILTKLLESLQKSEARLRVISRHENLGISATTNEGIDAATGDYVVFVDHDDLLEPDALFWIADAANRYPGASLIYTDEDKINEAGRLSAPHFKPDWNPLLFLGYNYINHLTAVDAELAKRTRLRSEFDGAQDYDFLLRATGQIEDSQIVHIPRVLYHWRAVGGSTALDEGEKSHALTKGLAAVRGYLDANFQGATADLKDRKIDVKFPVPNPAPSVAIVIPTRDGYLLLKEAIETCLTVTEYPNFNIYVIDNQSTDRSTLDYLKELSDAHKVKVFPYDAPFNFAAMHNAVIPLLDEDLILLLNNDTSTVSPNWLSEMVSLIDRFATKVVGAKLLYGDGTVQHAGVMAGMGGGAGHFGLNVPQDDPGYQRRYSLTQNLTAVTGACLLMDRKVYLEVGGMNEAELPVAFNDIDLCFRTISAGYRVAWTPKAVLIHHESKTRGLDGDDPWKTVRIQGEVSYLKLTWPQYVLDDPNYNPNLDILGNTFNNAREPRLPSLATFVISHFKEDGKDIHDSLEKLSFNRAEQLRHRYGLRLARDPMEARRKNLPMT